MVRARLGAADAAPADNRQSHHGSHLHGGRDRQDTVRLLCQQDGDVPDGSPEHSAPVFFQVEDLIVRQTHVDLAADDRCKSGCRAVLPDGIAHAKGKFRDARIDHAAEGRHRLDDHDRLSRLHGLLHLIGKDDEALSAVLRILCFLNAPDVLRRRGLLVDDRKQVHEVHPGIDVVVEVRRRHQVSLVGEKIALRGLVDLLRPGGCVGRRHAGRLLPGRVRQTFRLDADPSVGKDIEGRYMAPPAAHRGADAVRHGVLALHKADHVFRDVLVLQAHVSDMVRRKRHCDAAQDDRFPRIPHAHQLGEKGGVAQQGQQHISGDIVPVVLQPAGVFLLHIHGGHAQKLPGTERYLHLLGRTYSLIKIRRDLSHGSLPSGREQLFRGRRDAAVQSECSALPPVFYGFYNQLLL